MTTRNIQIHGLAIACILAVGFSVVWFFVASMIGDHISNEWLPHDNFESLEFACDGTPVVNEHSVDEQGKGIYRGLDGRRVRFPRSFNAYQGSDDLQQAPMAFLASQFQPTTDFRELGWNQRLIRLSAPNDCPMNWFFIHDGKLEGHGYLVGYDRKTDQKIGYIGRNGANDERPALKDQFPIDGRRIDGAFGPFLARGYNVEDVEGLNTLEIGPSAVMRGIFLPYAVFLFADDGLVQINVKERTATYIRKDAGIIAATTAFTNATTHLPEIAGGRFSGNLDQSILLRMSDRIDTLDMSGKQRQTWLLPKELRDCGIEWLQLSSDRALIRLCRYMDTEHNLGIKRDNELYWIDPAGKIVRHEKVDLKDDPHKTGVGENIIMSMVVPCPAAIQLLFWLDSTSRADIDAYYLLLGVCGFYGVVFAILCWRRHRKFGQPWTATWMLFVVLFGLPGYVGYRFHRRWPARLPCPHCGRRAPRDRMMCFHCGRDFPVPSAKGTEIFA